MGTALQAATVSYNLDIVITLLNNRADVKSPRWVPYEKLLRVALAFPDDFVHDRHSRLEAILCPIQLAARCNYLPMVEALLQRGADINDFVRWNDHKDVAGPLLKKVSAL